MRRRTAPRPSDAPEPEPVTPSEETAVPPDVEDAPGALGLPTDLTGLSVAGITRRRMAFLVAGFVTVWVVVLFARQVGDAAAATARADAMRSGNEALAGEVESLQRELDLIQGREYIVQQARAYRLGGPDEIPFTLHAAAPPLLPDAPGSASVRLGAPEPAVTPLESWLSLLFGPER